MSESRPLYLRPFSADRFYPVPHAWLHDVRHALELDARELVLWAHVPGTAEAAFPDDRPIAFWVRNEGELPNLMSHPTFGAHLQRMLGAADGDAADGDAPVSAALLKQESARPGWFTLANWTQMCDSGVLYKPRAYIEKRWPVRLNTHDWAGRAALLALCDMAAAQTVPGSSDVAAVEATVNQVRARIKRLLPDFAHGDKVSNSLLQLAKLNLVKQVAQARNNRTYALQLSGFDQKPIAPDTEIAALCGLHPADDAHWIDLIQELLDAQWKPPEACVELWAQLGGYRDAVTTVEDVEALTAFVQQKRKRGVTGLRRIVRDFLRTRQDDARWLDGHVFEMGAVHGARTEADNVAMPALHGADVHLRATQLVLRFRHPPHVTKQDVATRLSGAELTILQDAGMGYKAQFAVCTSLRLSKGDVGTRKVIDCNHLHGLVDYSRPFVVQMYRAGGDSDKVKAQAVTVVGHFRVKVTHR